MDITKCKGEECPLKEKCYRYIAETDKLGQSYLVKIPYNFKKEKCDLYWERI